MFVSNPGGPDTIIQSPTPTPVVLHDAFVSNGATTGAWSITSGGGTLSDTSQTDSPAIVTYTPDANYSGDVVLTLTTNGPGAVSATRTITVEPLPPSYPDSVDIYSLYNNALIIDQPYVDACILAIKTQIQYQIDNELDFFFDIDLSTQIGSLPAQQQNRIIDQVVIYYRNIGIRISSNSLLFTIPPTDSSVNSTLHVSWTIRNSREYMKTWL